MPLGSSCAPATKRASSASATHSGNPMPTKPPVAIVSPLVTSATAALAVTILPFSNVLSAASVSFAGRRDVSIMVVPVSDVSVEAGEVVDRDHDEYRERLDAGHR